MRAKNLTQALSQRATTPARGKLSQCNGQEANCPRPVSDAGQPAHSPPVGLPGRPKRLAECSDNYPYVIVQLNDRWRVVRCKDGIQWIGQYRHQAGPMGWRGSFYCQTLAGLLIGVRERVGEDAVALVKALGLPDRIQRP